MGIIGAAVATLAGTDQTRCIPVAYRTLLDPPLSQTGRIYQEIKWRIVYGHYRPGMHFSEATLARVHRGSRTPVREALSRLSEDGYVEWMPKRGFVIATVTVTMIRNTFQLRRLLEGTGAALAARVASAAEVEHMRQLADYQYVAGDAASYRAALARNLEFHLAVAAANHNDLLVDMVQYCLMQLDRVLSLGADFKPFEEGSSTEHHSVVEAIVRRDSPGARQLIEDHLDRSGRLIMENVMGGSIRGVAL